MHNKIIASSRRKASCAETTNNSKGDGGNTIVPTLIFSCDTFKV